MVGRIYINMQLMDFALRDLKGKRDMYMVTCKIIKLSQSNSVCTKYILMKSVEKNFL